MIFSTFRHRKVLWAKWSTLNLDHPWAGARVCGNCDSPKVTQLLVRVVRVVYKILYNNGVHNAHGMRQKCATLSFGKPHVLLNGLVCVQNLSLRWQSIVKYCEVLWTTVDERYLRQGMLRGTTGLYIGQTAYGWRSYCPNASQWWCDSMIWIHETGEETKGNVAWWWERLIFFFSEPFWEQDPSSSEVGEGGGGGGGAEHGPVGPLVRQRQHRSHSIFYNCMIN